MTASEKIDFQSRVAAYVVCFAFAAFCYGFSLVSMELNAPFAELQITAAALN
jgi:hypothetical protein